MTLNDPALEYLAEESDEGAELDPPVPGQDQELPLHLIPWPRFEALCWRLINLSYGVHSARIYGTPGEHQGGIDIFRPLRDDTYATYQCRRIVKMTPAKIKKAVDDFLKEDWAKRSDEFVLCTSDSTTKTDRTRAVQTQRLRLAKEAPPVAFETWDRPVLSLKLKDFPELVREFFGPAWLAEFLPTYAERLQRDEIVDAVREEFSSHLLGGVRLVRDDWAPERLRSELRRFEIDDPDLFRHLVDIVGLTPTAPAVVELIDKPPKWAREADGQFWELVARIAESLGEWNPAADAWQFSADCHESSDDIVRSLVSGATAATLAANEGRRTELIARAARADPQHPRLLVDAVDQYLPPQEQIASLRDILERATHSDDRLLVLAHLAIAWLMVPDLDESRALLPEIDELGKGTAVAESVHLSYTVQRGRLDVLYDRPLDTQELRGAQKAGLSLRARLRREGRWEEAARCLMLAAETRCLLGERAEASALLRAAVPEELASPTGAEVLGEAAVGRALDYPLALELIEGAADTPGIQRIRAEAQLEVGNTETRLAALHALDGIVADRNDESPEAAFARLAVTLGHYNFGWSDDASDCLIEEGHERVAISCHSLYLARWKRDYEGAEALYADHRDQPWAKILHLRLCVSRGNNPKTIEAADDVMTEAALQAHRVEAGRAYLNAGEFKRAREVLMNVAHEPSAPPAVRGDAFYLLMSVVGNHLGEWERAKRLHEEWIDLRPLDKRAPAWAVPIAVHARRQPDSDAATL